MRHVPYTVIIHSAARGHVCELTIKITQRVKPRIVIFRRVAR